MVVHLLGKYGYIEQIQCVTVYERYHKYTVIYYTYLFTKRSVVLPHNPPNHSKPAILLAEQASSRKTSKQHHVQWSNNDITTSMGGNVGVAYYIQVHISTPSGKPGRPIPTSGYSISLPHTWVELVSNGFNRFILNNFYLKSRHYL